MVVPLASRSRLVKTEAGSELLDGLGVCNELVGDSSP